MRLPSMMHQQQFQQHPSMFNDLGVLQQQKLSNINNSTVDNQIGFVASLPSQPQQSSISTFSYSSQQIVNAINNNGIPTAPYCQQSQRAFQSSFMAGNNHQNVNFLYYIILYNL